MVNFASVTLLMQRLFLTRDHLGTKEDLLPSMIAKHMGWCAISRLQLLWFAVRDGSQQDSPVPMSSSTAVAGPPRRPAPRDARPGAAPGRVLRNVRVIRRVRLIVVSRRVLTAVEAVVCLSFTLRSVCARAAMPTPYME